MGASTILDELQGLFDGLNVAAGSVDLTFPWVEWEEQEEARGAFCTAESEQDLEVSDIGGGAQAVMEYVTLRFMFENQGRDAAWSTWRNAFYAAVLAAVRGQERGFTGGYFVEVSDIESARFQLSPQGRGAAVYANQVDFRIVARRHDVYA